jgi:hypothetical protein
MFQVILLQVPLEIAWTATVSWKADEVTCKIMVFLRWLLNYVVHHLNILFQDSWVLCVWFCDDCHLSGQIVSDHVPHLPQVQHQEDQGDADHCLAHGLHLLPATELLLHCPGPPTSSSLPPVHSYWQFSINECCK